MTKANKEIKGFRLILGYQGLLLGFIGILELLPLINVLFYRDELSDGMHFFYPALGSIIVGGLLYLLIVGRPKAKLNDNQGLTLLLAVWIEAIIAFAIPWMTSGKMSFSRAIFECTSGFTTTGMTTCDVANTSHVFLFSRSLMTFLGGIGLVLILTTAISDKSRIGVYTSEGHNDKLLPNLAKSARLMLTIYLSFTILGSIALRISGLNWFDAINTTMSSISTGGFSTNPASIAGYNNLAAEIIVILLMAIGASNFYFHFLFLKFRFKKAFFNYEFFVGVALFAIFGTLMVIGFASTESFNKALRHGIFLYFTSMTGGGFTNVTTPVMGLTPFLIGLTIIVMAFGGQSGSTAGGIKHFRIAYISKRLKSYFYSKTVDRDFIKASFVYKFGEKVVVKEEEKNEAINYAFVYILTAIVGGLLISLCKDPYSAMGNKYGILESFFEFLSCLGTTGLSSGVTCQYTPSFALWVMSFGMFFGRLELTLLFVYIQRNINLAKHAVLAKKGARVVE